MVKLLYKQHSQFLRIQKEYYGGTNTYHDIKRQIPITFAVYWQCGIEHFSNEHVTAKNLSQL